MLFVISASLLLSFLVCEGSLKRSVYQNSNMALRLSGKTTIFGFAFFTSSLLWELTEEGILLSENLGVMLEFRYIYG